MLSETLHALGMPSSEYLFFVKQAVWVLKQGFRPKINLLKENQCTLLIQWRQFVTKCYNLIFKVNVKNRSISFFQFRIVD